MLEIYDHYRRHVLLPGLQREEMPGLVRHRTRSGEGTIVFSHLTEDDAEATIAGQVEEFRRSRAALEWLAYSHDTPGNLRALLERHGFVAESTDAIMMLDLEAAPAFPIGDGRHDLQRATTVAELREVAAIRQQIWGENAADVTRHLVERMRTNPEALSVFLAYVDGRPAATGQLSFRPEFGFASLVSAATLPPFRRRGLHAALLLARLREARARGIRYIDSEASTMSRPLLAKVGFLPISQVTVYSWRPGRKPEMPGSTC